jgi:hypothetical protein
MSDIPGELARVQGAYKQPTLTLLHQKLAPVIIAIFRSSFGRDVRTIEAARLHTQVDTYLSELRLAGHTELPSGNGRDLCLRWMRGQWLVRSADADGTEMYALTSHAQDALTLVKGLTRERASLSEHRIATIIAAVRRFNSDVNPDRAARVSILDAEIAKLTAERDRLLAGGEIASVSDDYMLEGYSELLQLVGGLSSEFARVEEVFAGLRTSILAAFRADDRPAGEVIDEYLRQADSLMTATPEGRAFEGAFALLRDDELMLQLREDLGALLEHPVADAVLIDADKRELRSTVALIRRGIDSVLVQRNRVTAALRDYIVTHNITRDRELDATLRQLDAELATWMRTAGPRAQVPLALLPARHDVQHLRERFHNTTADAAPPPLHTPAEHRPDGLSLEELLLQGGPTLEALRDALNAGLTGPEIVKSLGALFGSLEPQLRRPVEVFGLLHLATNRDDVAATDGSDIYAAQRPDGTPRPLTGPKIAPAGGAEQDRLAAAQASA